MSPERRIRLARERLDQNPHDPAAQREMAAAIVAFHRGYEELRDVCNRINARGGDA
jgi:hypothetical protein